MQLFLSSLVMYVVSLNAAADAQDLGVKKGPMTPQRFFEEIFNNPNNPKEWDEKKVEQYSTKKDPELFKKAQQDDLDAIFQLAQATESSDVPEVVPMYWYSRFSQLIDKVDNPEELDQAYKKLAESSLNLIYQMIRFEAIVRIRQDCINLQNLISTNESVNQ